MTLGWLEVPSIAVREALDEYGWAIVHGREPAVAMVRARRAAQIAAPGLKDVMSLPQTDGTNAEMLRRYEWEIGAMKATPFAAMRAALELEITLTETRAAEERRHALARQTAEAQSAALRRVRS